ncbi:MAG: hypothetical protein QM503_07170 [Bacteroidota bacterium]
MSKTTFGQISLASLAICVISGVIVAIPFDVENPFLSISTMMVLNPAASLFRNIHFWSAQIFLVFVLIHIWDHFKKSEAIVLKKGVWLRLTLGIVVIFMVMLTGFLLKGDADSKQAWRILDSLLISIPIIGNVLSYSLLGDEGSLQLVYIHHIATLTIFIVIITFEHSRKIWAKTPTFIVVLLILLIISYFFTPPLHDGVNSTVKGPWYFVGFQEILHWLSTPSISIILIILFLVLIFIIPYAGKKVSFFSKRSLLFFTVLYVLLTLSGLFFRGENWNWIWPWEKDYSYSVLHSFNTSQVNFTTDFTDEELESITIIDGAKESCVICHNNVTGFTLSHSPDAIGCFSCHGGNPFDGSKNGAHADMILIPGNFSNADQSCGTTNCHPDITSRKNSNIMDNLSGMISVNRFVFNEQDNPDIITDVHHLGNTAADEHLKNMCVICHLGNPKTETGPVTESSRGGGCLACHINYDEFASTAWYAHNDNEEDTTYLNFHPSISMKVTNQHCFGCHSRSGRISTNYEGWHETTLEVEEMPLGNSHRLVEESRVFRFISEDVHFGLGLSCIDCHNGMELMGDGTSYAHQEDQSTISCSDCHFSGKPNLIRSKDIDSESAIIASMRFGNISDKDFLATKKRDIPLINTYYKNDTAYFLTKNHAEKFVLSKPGSTCTKGTAHDKLSCSSCHSAWAPSCIGCHNEYDESESGYNMYTNTKKQGSWVEFVGEYNAHLPALGVRTNENIKEIIPVVPGMVLTIDVASYSKDIYDSLIFRRLFAPSAPHTTSVQGRNCKSCHNNPVALGYGDGNLDYEIKNNIGIWSFTSLYHNNPNDNIPEDAWVGFMDDRKGEVVSTRSNVKPFTISEQQSILAVGSCLTCHNDNSTVMQQSLINFDSVVNKRKVVCVIPVW